MPAPARGACYDCREMAVDAHPDDDAAAVVALLEQRVPACSKHTGAADARESYRDAVVVARLAATYAPQQLAEAQRQQDNAWRWVVGEMGGQQAEQWRAADERSLEAEVRSAGAA